MVASLFFLDISRLPGFLTNPGVQYHLFQIAENRAKKQ